MPSKPGTLPVSSQYVHPLLVVRDILQPRERRTVTEWADQHRVLSRKFTAEPGPFRTSRTPYLRDVMDAFADPDVQRITLLKSARVGGSEAMNNCLLYGLDRAPGPILYVLPTEQDAKEEATGRIKNMIEDCHAMGSYIPYEGFASAREITLSGPRTIYMGWAAAPRTLIRRTCRYVFFDELDNCEREAGALGEHLSVAAERTTTYGYKGKVMSATTPTTSDAAASTDYANSDQRRYYVPCSHCGAYQVFVFSQIKWPEDKRDADEIERDDLAWYECKFCKEQILERDRMWMVERGCWIPGVQEPAESLPLDRPDIVEAASDVGAKKWTPRLEGERPRTRRVGFHIWSAYSPWRTFSMIASEFIRTHTDPERFRVFVNSWLGEAWSDTAIEVDATDLTRRRVDSHARDEVPPFVLNLGMSADTQKDGFLYEIRGWGPNRQSTLIREGYCDTFETLYAIFQLQFKQVDGDKTTMMAPRFLAIDSGGDRTKEVYEFAKTHAGVMAIKGHGRVANWYVKPSKIEYSLKKGGVAKRSLRIYNINVDFYKDALARMMKIEDPADPGFWGLHSDTTQDYLDQVTAERKIWVKKNRNGVPIREKVWALKASGRANHFLDTAVYAMAIADFLGWLNLSNLHQQAQRQRSSTKKRQDPREFLAQARRSLPRR